jgi:hypothetical protein
VTGPAFGYRLRQKNLFGPRGIGLVILREAHTPKPRFWLQAGCACTAPVTLLLGRGRTHVSLSDDRVVVHFDGMTPGPPDRVEWRTWIDYREDGTVMVIPEELRFQLTLPPATPSIGLLSLPNGSELAHIPITGNRTLQPPSAAGFLELISLTQCSLPVPVTAE